MNKTTTQTIDAEIVEEMPQTTAVSTSKRFINENGDVNLSILSKEQIDKCRAITKNLNPNVVGSVNNFGSELQSQLAQSGKSFLTKTRTSHSGEVGDMLNQLVATLDTIDMRDVQAPSRFMQIIKNIPILNHFAPNINKVLRKYDKIEESINVIQSNIEASRATAMRDNNELQVMFDGNVEYIKQVEALIVGGTLALEEAQNEVNTLIAEDSDAITIHDKQMFIEQLDKKIHDLKTVRQIAKQNLMQIRVIQQNNITTANNAQSMITMTLPVFQSQMALAVALSNQSDNLKVQKAVRDKTNEILKANANALHKNSIEATKAASESVVHAETVKETANKLKETISEIKKIQEDAHKKRQEEAAELARIEHDIDVITTASTNLIDNTPKGITLD